MLTDDWTPIASHAAEARTSRTDPQKKATTASRIAAARMNVLR